MRFKPSTRSTRAHLCARRAPLAVPLISGLLANGHITLPSCATRPSRPQRPAAAGLAARSASRISLGLSVAPAQALGLVLRHPTPWTVTSADRASGAARCVLGGSGTLGGSPVSRSPRRAQARLPSAGARRTYEEPSWSNRAWRGVASRPARSCASLVEALARPLTTLAPCNPPPPAFPQAAVRVTCTRGCEDEPYHRDCVARYLKGRPAPRDWEVRAQASGQPRALPDQNSGVGGRGPQLQQPHASAHATRHTLPAHAGRRLAVPQGARQLLQAPAMQGPGAQQLSAARRCCAGLQPNLHAAAPQHACKPQAVALMLPWPRAHCMECEHRMRSRIAPRAHSRGQLLPPGGLC